MKMGQKVLTQIENLLTQIDKPRTKKRQHSIHQPDDAENYSVHNKLFNISKLRQIKQNQKVQQKINDEEKFNETFKVSNKHSLFLVNQVKKKPFHERIDQIQMKKQQSLINLRQKYSKTRAKEDEQLKIIEQMEERKKKERKFTKKQLQQKLLEYQFREKQRNRKINRMRIQVLQKHTQQFRRKPYMKEPSQRIWKSYKMKRDLSSSVFERFQQYQNMRKMHLEQTQSIIKSRITPFYPKISQTSRLIASQMKSRSDLSKSLSKSISCQRFERSISRRKLHNNSTAMHSSRKKK